MITKAYQGGLKEMKKIILNIVAILLVITSFMPVSAEEFKHETVYATDKASVEYLPEYNGYLLKNVDIEKIEELFERITLDECDEKHTQTAESIFKMSGSDMANAQRYAKTFYTTLYMTGLTNDTVALNYTAAMNMTVTYISGVGYEAFVSPYATPTMYPGDPNYTTGPGNGSITPTVMGTGSYLRLTQIVQLQRTLYYSVSVSYPWLLSYSAGSEYTYRTTPATKTAYIYLPLYYILVG